jgi:hypothetical protein
MIPDMDWPARERHARDMKRRHALLWRKTGSARDLDFAQCYRCLEQLSKPFISAPCLASSRN